MTIPTAAKSGGCYIVGDMNVAAMSDDNTGLVP